MTLRVRPFLLDRWLNEHQFSTPPIEFDLAASTGPKWTWRALVSELAPDAMEAVLDEHASYGPATGSADVRSAVAEMAGVDASAVTVVTGASEALWILMLVAARDGGNVVLPDPGYPTFDEAARLLRLDVHHYHLRPGAANGIDVDELHSCIDDGTVLVVVNTPHNPTGAVVAEAELVALGELAASRGVQLVVDEVYHPIYHGPPSTSAAQLAGATTIGDMSKALCLGGLRVGWIIDHDPARVEQYEDARAYLTISGSPMNEALAAGAIRARATLLDRAQSVATANLGLLADFIEANDEVFGWVRPAGGLTAFPWLRAVTDARPFCVDAAAAGVLVAPGDCFGHPAHVRIGFGATEVGFADAISRLDDVVAAR